jgi:metal-responsive CopG/Arc/MetJ family transcriptional regulator
MAKTNISMPDGMLDDVDRRAGDAGLTRSGFVQEAIAHYGAQLDSEKAQRERAERLGQAAAKMRAIAPLVGAPDAERVIREVRDAPPRWDKR